ncbi:hypothetical protein MTR67_006988 [Solanum verrucosum]|uniref:Peptidase S9A N-terminal domain-containing protein n=1 Tax=Solanum verrucosum TaxID=315347 RepID=A0AAF0PYW8_SOLVR|nr:hypothetical protein MTR67_006988 [Solanum verrucosum]
MVESCVGRPLFLVLGSACVAATRAKLSIRFRSKVSSVFSLRAMAKTTPSQSPSPPTPKKLRHDMELFGDVRVDNYYWLRDDSRSNPELLSYLHEENAYTDSVMSVIITSTLWLRKSFLIALWYRVIKSKYEELNTWVTKEVNTPYDISLWKSIRIFWQILSNQLTVKVRNGKKTSFWVDKWMGTASLKDLFPNIFVLAQHQQKTIAEMWSPQGWNMILRRNLNDWEIPRMIKLLKLPESSRGIQIGRKLSEQRLGLVLEWKNTIAGVVVSLTGFEVTNHRNEKRWIKAFGISLRGWSLDTSIRW